MIPLSLLLLLSGCAGQRQGYEISENGVAVYVAANCVVWCDVVLQHVYGADPKTFVQLSAYPALGKDAFHAFFEDQVITGANAASFRQLSGGRYSADDNTIFFEAKRLAEADVTSFRALADDYAVDAHNSYLLGDVVPDARGALTPIPYNGYARDEANQIFYRACGACELRQVDACDGASFVAGMHMRAPEAWDSLCVYADAKRLPLTDRASFRYLGDRWSKDVGGVYYGNQRIDGADPATFGLVRGDNGGTTYGSDASGRCWFGTYQTLSSCPSDAKPYAYPELAPASAYAPDR